ncbi:MAG: hemolysin family protein [Fusicatenibacter sp.]|nr:hemolysin family protein [Lachnospiraceae bacterium]MDY2938826.1 hemolysin family protein [Fusicatenibacter sp.]
MNSDTVSLVLIVICIILSAYFSATETAFSALNKVRIKNMAEKGNSKAALVLKLSDNFDNLLSTILIGNNIVNIGLTSLTTVMFVKLLGNESGASVSTLVTTIVVLIFGEVSPKSIAKESPETVAMFTAPLLHCFQVVLTPFNYLFSLWKKLLSKLITSTDDHGITDEELMTIVEEATQEGGIDDQEGDLIQNAIGFMEMEAAEIFTPRVDVVGISLDATKAEIARTFSDTGYSRLPVYDEDIDHIVGIVYQKDFHNHVFHTNKPLSSIIRPALFVTENTKIGPLLKMLQAKKSHIAIIIDEFGGTDGIITMEDILEELVGEIWDEHDSVVEEIQKISDTEYIATGTASIDKLYEELEIDKEFDVFTVSGWVMGVLERVPKEGDHFSCDHLEVTVLKMADRRIEKVRIQKLPPETDTQE